MDKKEDYVRWFSELSSNDVGIAGGKGASLAEMYNNKFPIPPGFAITAQAYKYFVEKTEVQKKIETLLDKVDIDNSENLEEHTKAIRKLITDAEMPNDLADEIIEAYEILDVDKGIMKNARQGGALEILRTGHEPPFVAVRSSATAEDLADASFAGQQETFLNVKGKNELIEKVKGCFASLYTARATYYREKKGFKHGETYLSVIVQKMIDSEKSGVIFSKNPVNKNNSILIEAVYGLGEGIVSGRIKPDSYVVKGNVENFEILEESIGNKKIAIIRDSSGKNQIVKLTEERSNQRVLSDYELKMLSKYAQRLEEHYGKPQDIEFAIEGENIYIVQSRPITTLENNVEEAEVNGKIILTGIGASPGIGSGVVKIVHSMDDLKKIRKGDVLVTEMTNPDMVISMQKAAAIITDEGGITSHAAIVSREMGIPAIVGTGDATSKLKDGDEVTVVGSLGKVIEGRGETKLAEVNPIVKETNTKIKVIVDLPEYAERAAKTHVKGVGLTRIEGIIAISGKHPLWYVKNNNTKAYVETLYRGLKKILEHFEEIWIRTSDIRSDEYKNLEGAPQEIEGNPMLGNHGIRFGLKNPEILKAEITAAKEIADDFPNKKVGIMMPGVISVDEIKRTKEFIREIGVPNNVKLGVMVETPASVELINEFCEEGIKFISFGTNDLTQYMLAVDRNNSEVQEIYEEMNPAVKNAIKYVIRRCKRYGVETSICGQAGSREDMVEFLVKEKIDSISVNADAAEKISELVARLEEEDNGKKEIPESKNKEKYDLMHPHHQNKLREEIEKEIEKRNKGFESIAPIISVNNPENIKEENLKGDNIPQEDIENEILKELDDEFEDRGYDGVDIEVFEPKENVEELSEKNEYMPSPSEDRERKNIPSLNESIDIEYEDLIEEDKGDEVLDIF